MFLTIPSLSQGEDLNSVVVKYKQSNVALEALRIYECWVQAAKKSGCAGETNVSLKDIILKAVDDCKEKAEKYSASNQVSTFKTCADKILAQYANSLKGSSEQVQSCTGKSASTCK